MPSVGELLAGRYRIDGVLGAGGMASVYAATDLRLERKVAVKVLLPNLARDRGLAERFDREARILASVSHPSVAEVFDVERGDPDAAREPFYVMELCEGGSLMDRIDATGALEPGELIPMIVSIAAALGELHRRGLIHRDVKPSNILFTGGRPKLADFGLAKSGSARGTPDLTEPGTAVGTPAYMAPELASGDEATVASDVYALAATTFHGLTGRAPRRADSLTGLVGTLPDALPRVSDVSPRLGFRFDAVIAAATGTNPSSRLSLGELMSGLVIALGQPRDAVPAGRTDDVDADTTVIATPALEPRIATAVAPLRPERAEPSSRHSARRPIPLALFAVAVAIAGLALAGLALLASGPGLGGSTPSVPPSVGPTPSASAPGPTPVVTASPGPTLSVDLALLEVVQAIEAARGGPDGLGGNQARDLLDLADRLRESLDDREYAEARTTAAELLERARALTDGIDDERARVLIAAIRDLQALLAGS